jgi:hypothetical protein
MLQLIYNIVSATGLVLVALTAGFAIRNSQRAEQKADILQDMMQQQSRMNDIENERFHRLAQLVKELGEVLKAHLSKWRH